jgi:hypothetical protein
VEDARAWLRWWRLEGLPEMRALLWEKRDPLALRGIAPDDEYDGYARVLGSKLKRSNGRANIADYLTTLLAEGGHHARVGRTLQPYGPRTTRLVRAVEGAALTPPGPETGATNRIPPSAQFLETQPGITPTGIGPPVPVV